VRRNRLLVHKLFGKPHAFLPRGPLDPISSSLSINPSWDCDNSNITHIADHASQVFGSGTGGMMDFASFDIIWIANRRQHRIGTQTLEASLLQSSRPNPTTSSLQLRSSFSVNFWIGAICKAIKKCVSFIERAINSAPLLFGSTANFECLSDLVSYL